MHFETALSIDVTVLSICVTLLLYNARLTHSHPATIYLFFHIYVVTFRLLSLTMGALSLWSNLDIGFDSAAPEEIVRAAWMADVALVVMTAVWVLAAAREARRKAPRVDSVAHPTLSVRYIWRVVSIAFPIGLFGLAYFAFLPGVERMVINPGEWQRSTWVAMTQTWAGLSILALIYWYGFRRWLIVPMVFYLLIMAYQGYHRFRVIIPALLLLQIYLDRHKLRWPSVRVAALLFALLLLFFPLKTIGRMAQQGATLAEIVDASAEIIRSAFSGEAGDQEFLDQFAVAVTLIDENQKFYYGTTYLALLTLPIPRPWWPDKPGLADYMKNFSQPRRPMDQMGMIVTFLGEAYANFGYLGIIIIPVFLAYWLARACFFAYRHDYFSVVRFAYLLAGCSFIELYRGGLSSIIVFTLVNMMPLMFIVLLHILVPVKRGPASATRTVRAAYHIPDARRSPLPRPPAIRD